MTPQQYIEHGYRISLQVSQAEIDKAERDIVFAYISAICPLGDPNVQPYPASEEVNNFLSSLSQEDWKGDTQVVFRATAALVMLLLAQRGVIGTRSGGKIPTAVGAMSPASDDIVAQYSRESAMYIDKSKSFFLQKFEPETYKALNATLRDICGIYFKTNFYCG